MEPSKREESGEGFPPPGLLLKISPRFRLFALVFFPLFFLYLSWTAWILRIDYFDSFDIFLNARELAGIHDGPWFWKKPLLLPILFSPVFRLTFLGLSTAGAVALCRLACVLLCAGFLWSAYRHFRLAFGRDLSLAGALLVALNPLIIHYTPFVREDIPAAFFLSAGFYFYLRSRKSRARKDYAWGFAFMSLAMLARFNVIPVPFMVILFCEALPRSIAREDEPSKAALTPAVLSFLFLPLAAVFFVASCQYALRGECGFLQGPGKFLEDLNNYYGVFSADKDTWWENFAFLARSFSLPVIFAAAAGAFSCWRRKSFEFWFYGAWLAGFLFLHTLVIQHKEARYLFPCFVPLYFFSVRGIQAALTAAPPLAADKTRRILFFAAAFVFVLMPVKNGVFELVKFRDPFYTNPFMERVSRAALALKKEDGKIIWFGPKYPLFPREHLFHPEDEFTYVYHFYNHVVRFYSGTRVFAYEYGPSDEPQIMAPLGGSFGYFIPGIGRKAENGDVIILNNESEDYRERNLPGRLYPLVLERVRTAEFPYAETNGQAMVFKAPGGQMSLTAEDRGGQLVLTEQGLPDGVFEIYRTGGSERESIGYAVIRKGKALIRTGEGVRLTPGGGLSLLGFDSITLVAHTAIPVKEMKAAA